MGKPAEPCRQAMVRRSGQSIPLSKRPRSATSQVLMARVDQVSRRIPILLTLIIGAAVLAPGVALAQFEDESVIAFRAADSNGDELLTPTEFRVFIQQMAIYGAPMSQRIRALGAYGIAFGRVDADGNGLATPEELRAADRSAR